MQAHPPLVSVIIVNYNTGSLLTQAVKSVINLPDVEVVVADNASTDNSFALLRTNIHSPNLTLLDHDSNLGFGLAVNQAVKQSRGHYIFLLNPDASLNQKTLSHMVATARKYGDRAIIAPRLENSDGTAQPSCYRPQTIRNAIKEYWLGIKGAYAKYLPPGPKPVVVHAAVAAAWLISRATWDELGGLNSRFFLYFEDLDMCDRAALAGIPVVYDPQAAVQHAHGVSSRTNPVVLQLFTQSARVYHGRVKKLVIDAIIRIRDFFVPPVSPKKILGITLVYSLLVACLAALGYFLLPSRYAPSALIPSFYHSNFLLWSWANFDGEHYLNIAGHGYQTLRGQSEYAFFPLFPLLIKLVSLTGLDLYLSSHLIILGSFVGFAFFLLRWVAKYTRNPLAVFWTVLLSPGAVFLAAIYTEPLFLLLAAATFYFSEQRQWGRAAVTTALATATRVNGIFLVLFLLIKLLRNKKHTSYSILHTLYGSTGFIVYTTYLFFQTGNPLAWYTAQVGWQKSTPTWPWVTLGNYVSALTVNFRPDLTHLVVAIEVILTFTLIYLLIRFWRQTKLDVAYKYYCLANLALPLATGSLGSLPRFALALFPLFVVIPSLPRIPRLLIYTLFVTSCMLGIVLFTRGYWYA